ALYVGLIGLCAFLPLFLLALPAGETADRHTRRKILMFCMAGEIFSVSVLLVTALLHATTIPVLLGISFVFGTSRAFLAPASTSTAPMLVPRTLLPRAIAWNSLAWQSAAVTGPAVGGLLIAISPSISYGTSLALYALAGVAIFLVRKNTRPEQQPGSRLELIKEGLAYLWSNKIVLGAISLDLVAVLLGGVTALLPVFAKDLLHVGSQGFGALRAAPAFGASAVAIYLAAHPIKRHAGKIMFVTVGIFGATTVVFGLSRLFALSMAVLVLQGASDMASIYVRQTLVQLVTPDHMRGRVSSVAWVFVSASNELGEFSGGVLARLLGPIGAALFGGFGSMTVTGLWSVLFPALRKADKLE
ncbi:MAG: MFS transporter, partial [Alphaproteobacteria bacterium]